MAILGSGEIFYGFVYFTAMIIFRKPKAKERLLDKNGFEEEFELPDLKA